MEFGFTPEQRRFRLNVRRYVRGLVPTDFAGIEVGTEDPGEVAFLRRLERKLADKGWLVMHWPAEYGGGGKTAIESGIFSEEFAYTLAVYANPIGVFTAGPIIMHYGTPEQKARFLPGIARSEHVYAEGYTEPEAGSDLASLRTRAVRVGDSYIINGQKAFNTLAHNADLLWLAARTDPNATKHRGISLFVVDINTPGITVQRQPGIGGGSHDDLFMDNVRVPADRLIGEENRGWYYITHGLYTTLSPIRDRSYAKRLFDDFVVWCQRSRWNGRALFDNPMARHRLAEIAIDFEVWRLLGWRVVFKSQAGDEDTHYVSLARLVGKEVGPRFAKAVRDIAGLTSVVHAGSPLAPLSGRLEHLMLRQYSNHAGGTPEIHRNVIALRGLGLPRPQ